MEGETKKKVLEDDSVAQTYLYNLLLYQNEKLLKELQDCIEENISLRSKLEDFQVREEAPPEEEKPANQKPNEFRDAEGNLITENDKIIEHLQNEKLALEQHFVDINVDLQNKKQTLEELQDEIAAVQQNIKTVDNSIAEKDYFLRFLQEQYELLKSKQKEI